MPENYNLKRHGNNFNQLITVGSAKVIDVLKSRGRFGIRECQFAEIDPLISAQIYLGVDLKWGGVDYIKTRGRLQTERVHLQIERSI